MSRRGQLLRRFSAVGVALLLPLSATPIPAARAAAGSGRPSGPLTSQFPLGTRTLCCGRGSGTTTTPATAPGHRAAPPASAAKTPKTAKTASGHGGGVPIVLLAVVAVLALAGLGALEYRRSRRRASRERERDDETMDEAQFVAPGPVERRPRPHVGTAEPVAPEPVEHTPEPDVEEIDFAELLSIDPVLPPPASGTITKRPTVRRVRREESVADDAYDADEAGVADDADGGDDPFELGITFYERGQMREAEVAWRLAVEHRHVRAAAHLAMLLEQQGDLDGARQASRNAEQWADRNGETRGLPTARDRGLR